MKEAAWGGRVPVRRAGSLSCILTRDTARCLELAGPPLPPRSHSCAQPPPLGQPAGLWGANTFQLFLQVRGWSGPAGRAERAPGARTGQEGGKTPPALGTENGRRRLRARPWPSRRERRCRTTRNQTERGTRGSPPRPRGARLRGPDCHRETCLQVALESVTDPVSERAVRCSAS